MHEGLEQALKRYFDGARDQAAKAFQPAAPLGIPRLDFFRPPWTGRSGNMSRNLRKVKKAQRRRAYLRGLRGRG